MSITPTIESVKASKAKMKRQRDNWKARAVEADGVLRELRHELREFGLAEMVDMIDACLDKYPAPSAGDGEGGK